MGPLTGQSDVRCRLSPAKQWHSSLACAGANEGKELYVKACRSCHGADGQGNPAIAKMMKVELRALGSQEVQSQSDAELKKAMATLKFSQKLPHAVFKRYPCLR